MIFSVAKAVVEKKNKEVPSEDKLLVDFTGPSSENPVIVVNPTDPLYERYVARITQSSTVSELLPVAPSIKKIGLCNSKIGDSESGVNRWRFTGIIFANQVFELEACSLKMLTLDGNRLTSLPDEFMIYNRSFRVSRNLLTSLPETIGRLRYVTFLSAPDSIGGCFLLEELQANDNSMKHLPLSTCNLNCLKSLCMDNNNVSQIPQNLLKDCKAFLFMGRFQDFEGGKKSSASLLTRTL
ncbi:hypothetical protein MKX03_000677 [Papaver bracteatum]|nr:hypothetical protein MKX03_000677 [Papaver bracteatum]